MFFHLRCGGKLFAALLAARNILAHLAVLVKVGLGGESKGAGLTVVGVRLPVFLLSVEIAGLKKYNQC